jgi:hypothetical protein
MTNNFLLIAHAWLKLLVFQINVLVAGSVDGRAVLPEGVQSAFEAVH